MPIVEPLTPTPGRQDVVIPWPVEGGPWLLTVDLSRVDGRTTVTGLRIAPADPADPAPVDHPMLRGLQAGRIAEAARARLVALLAGEAARGVPGAAAAVETLLAPPPPRPARPREAGARLQEVARLYLRAVGAGGDQARRPAVYVHGWLIDAGADVTLAAVRGQIHRARVKGLIPARQDR